MPINFDPNSLNNVFDKNFGSGSFNAGLSNASNAARLKQQASLAKTDYLKRLTAAKTAALKQPKKTFQDALDYWDSNKSGLIKDGAYKTTNDLLNDPQKQQLFKDAGYNINDLVDAAYNSASNGTYTSKRAYDQYASQLNKDTAPNRKQNQSEIQQVRDLDKAKAEAQKAQQQAAKSTANNMSFYDKLNAGAQRIGDQFLRTISPSFANWNDQQDKELAQYELKKNPTDLSAIKALNRANASTAPATTAGQKALNYIGGTVGTVAPFLVGDGLLGAAGKAMPALNAAKAVTNPYAKLALQGGASGLVGSGLQMGANSAVSGQKYTPGQIASNLAINAGAGAVGAPLLHGAGQLIGKALGKGAKGSAPPPTQELLGLPAPQLRLNAPQLQLEGPKPLAPSLDALNQAGKMPGELKNPIPPTTKVLSGLLNEKQPFGTLGDRLNNLPGNRPMADFSNAKPVIKGGLADRIQSLPQDRQLPDFSYGKPVTDNSVTNAYGVSTPFDPMQHGTPAYWQKRYEDFANYVNSHYDTNHLSKPALEDLWSQFAGYNEPVKLDQLAELAFKDVKGPTLDAKNVWDQLGNRQVASNKAKQIMGLPENVDTNPKQPIDTSKFKLKLKQESTLKDLLKADPRINELAKGLHFKAPQQKVSRLATLEEMIQRLKESAPQNTPVEPQPLQFAREKGFNPNLKPNILNRGNADAPNLEGLKNIKPGKSQGYTNIGSAPKTLSPDALDNHGYGLIDTQAKPNPFDVPYKSGDPLPDTSGHIGTKTGKLPLNVKSAVDKGYIKTVDNLHRLSQFDKQVENVLGKGLSASEKTHTLGLNSRGSDMISKQILTSNMVNKNGEAVGNSLKDITMQVPKGKLKQFEDYLVNKHAITRMERGEKVFPDQMQMTIGKSMRIVKNYEKTNPEFKNLANQYYDYNKQLGQHWLVDTGILSKKDWEGYLQANPHYVPNNRIFSDMERPLFYGTKKGFANQSNPVKKAIGSQRQIVSPIESTIEHTAQYVKTAKRNEVMQTLINNIKQDPKAFKDWAEIVPTDKTPASVMETLQKEGVDGVLGELNKGFDQKPDLTKGNIVTGIIDGQKVHVKVNDPYLLDAITNLQPKAQNLVIHSLGQVTRVMKNLTTGINPVFSLTRNVFRDIPTAFTNSKSTNNPLVFSKDLVQSFVSVMKNDNLYKSFKAIGGGHSSPISSSVNLLAQSKNSILPQKGLKPLLSKGLGKLENLNNAIEAAPRLAEYKRIAGNTYDSKMNALYEANDVTVNFNKYGNVSKEIDSVIPYFNAAVQGLDKTGRAFLNPKTAPVALTKAFAAITVPSMLAYAVNYNDPNYQKVSNYIKDTNILIPKGDGTFFKIPVPRELGTVFHAGVNRVMRAWVEQDPKAFDGFAQDLVSNFALPTRSILAPFNDIRANKNYIGAPIVPQDLQGLSPKYQYDAQTSEPAKAIGNLINVSPKQIDYLTKSYGGVLGELGIPATTKNTTIGQTLKQKVTVDPAYSNDIMSNFYNQKSKLDQANADFTKQGIQSSNMNEGLRKAMNTQATLISKLRKQTKTVQNDSTLTPAQRLARLRQLQETMNQIASQNAR